MLLELYQRGGAERPQPTNKADRAAERCLFAELVDCLVVQIVDRLGAAAVA